MPSDAWSPNPIPKHKSLESLKQTFQKRLEAILNRPLTFENIDGFAEKALKDATRLVTDIRKEYATNPALQADPALNTEREQEDKALQIVELSDVPGILDDIMAVEQEIRDAKEYIDKDVGTIGEVMAAPEAGSGTPRNAQERLDSPAEKRIFPRRWILAYILLHDFEIKWTDENLKRKGGVAQENSYYRIHIEAKGGVKDRVVYVSDEEDNSTFIFDTIKLAELGLGLEDIDRYSKEEKTLLLETHPGLGRRIIHSESWAERVSELLKYPIPEKPKEERSNAVRSEFKRREKKDFLPFSEFQTDVIRFYKGEGNVGTWYQEEQKKHPNWPASPYEFYKSDGWEGYPELVNRENRLKKDFLPFADLRDEVRTWYKTADKKTSVSRSYKQEQKKHPRWPSSPADMYEDQDWQGWEEFVERYLPFDKFQKEVTSLCPPDVTDIRDWYVTELPNHPNWYSNPQKNYKGKGWIGWPELVGRENRIKKFR